ncbi:ABC transporter ATP-binding protein [Georgenia subflava]|uniref:ATP-binding cassette domain-containing protein n=1 Tax=Georgenia subflava TaxID=1622177 RepID=A0A6N7EGC5_9MICO|nr:ABC transporter ATP-binding protein [Georgenia subflava]MPV37442.1 ATP-binding cassette domain-containing protein [Georgenia subflava]
MTATVPDYGHAAQIVCDNLLRIYRAEGVEVVALQGLDLLVDDGELVAVIGASGSGKSTLLHILSGLDRPTAGLARVAGQDLLTMSARDRLRYRREVVGFLYQQANQNLLPYLDAAENLALPMLLTGVDRADRSARVAELLDMLDLTDVRGNRLDELSGGQQQRVALGVALANQPQVLLADEPTGELDTESSDQVFAALRTVNAELGVTVVVVTHDDLVSEQVQRTVGIRDGRTSSEVLRRTEVDEHGRESLVAEEYAVLDRAGRLQLPRDFTTALDMRDRVRLDLEADHIGVWPAASPASPDDGPDDGGPTPDGREPR